MKVLLASDGSSDSMHAAHFVLRLTKQNSLDVHVVTVSYPPEIMASEVLPPWSKQWHSAEKKKVETLHAELMLLLSKHCHSVMMNHVNGHVAQTILEEAARLDVDLIVLGAKGHSMIHRVLLGSVSDFVATHATCSVVIARGENCQAKLGTDDFRILLGFDQSQSAGAAVSELMNLGWGEDTELNFLSAAPYPIPLEAGGFASMDTTWEPGYIESIRCAAERAASRASNVIGDCSVQLVRSNHPGDAIVNAAENLGSDLVFVGNTGHGMLEQWLLGSTSKYVIRHATCNVWISRSANSETNQENQKVSDEIAGSI